MLVPLYQSIETHTSEDENRQHTTFLSGTIFSSGNLGLTKSRNCRIINLYFLTCCLYGPTHVFSELYAYLQNLIYVVQTELLSFPQFYQ